MGRYKSRYCVRISDTAVENVALIYDVTCLQQQTDKM